jgi:hypothetical protein
VSVLGRPQNEWDEFLEETRKPRRRWSLGRILWIVIPAAFVAALVVHHYAG